MLTPVLCENPAEARFQKAPPRYDVVGNPLPSGTLHQERPYTPRWEPTRICVKLPPMDPLPPPLTFFLLLFSGWINRQQQGVIEYLREENRILRAAYGLKRVRLTDDQRRRLAVKGNALGRLRRADVAGIVTPDTILRWYRRLVAKIISNTLSRAGSRFKRTSQWSRFTLPI
jgi:hypothetical protein